MTTTKDLDQFADLTDDEKNDIVAAIDEVNAAEDGKAGQPRGQDGKYQSPSGDADETQNNPSGADDDAGDDDDAAADETSGEAGKAPEWLDEQAQELADSYGLTGEDLAEFDSLEDLQRYGRLFDARILREEPRQTTEEAGEEQGGESRRPEQQQQQDDEADDSDDSGDAEAFNLDKFDAETLDEYLDPELAGVFKGLVSTVQQLQQRDQQRAEAAAEAEFEAFNQRFDELVDALDPELFGGEGEELSDEQVKLRSQLFDTTVRLLERGNGRLNMAAVTRAYHANFHEHISKKERAAIGRAARKRSKQRMKGGGSRQKHQGEWDGDPEENPSLGDAFQTMLNDQ